MPKPSSRVPRFCLCPVCQEQPEGEVAQEHQDLNRLVASLDEKARRRVVGFLARQYGRGGLAHFSRITGLSRNTIQRGSQELDQDLPEDDRIRGAGGGRPRVEKKLHRSPKR